LTKTNYQLEIPMEFFVCQQISSCEFELSRDSSSIEIECHYVGAKTLVRREDQCDLIDIYVW